MSKYTFGPKILPIFSHINSFVNKFSKTFEYPNIRYTLLNIIIKKIYILLMPVFRKRFTKSSSCVLHSLYQEFVTLSCDYNYNTFAFFKSCVLPWYSVLWFGITDRCTIYSYINI